MKRRLIFFVLLVTFIEFFGILTFTTGFECSLENIEVDKEFYYPDETIIVNATWELYYNPINEEAYVQVRCSDEFDNLLWNSSKYDEIGNNTEIWYIYINQLNLTLNNYTNRIYLKFLCIYHQIGTMDIISNLIKTIQINIIKRTPSCQLIGFKDRIIYGESLSFQAKFYDNLIENSTYLNNQLITFRISSNNSVIFQNIYTTNDSGMVDIQISSIDDLRLGINVLELNLSNNYVFNDSLFQYELIVDKSPVFIDIINFKEIIDPLEDIMINLFYYYFINDTKHPLESQYIELLILSENNISFTQMCYTDMDGILLVSIPQDLLLINKKNKELQLILIYNGSQYLDNITLSLSININSFEPGNETPLNFVPVVSITAALVISSIFIMFKVKKPAKKILPEITIRY